MPSLGPLEVLVIIVVGLVVLGPARLPEAGRHVGRALSEFRRWSNLTSGELRSLVDAPPEHAPDGSGPAVVAGLPAPTETPVP